MTIFVFLNLIIGTSLMATVVGSNLIKPEPAISQNGQNDFTPDEALAKLMEGNQRFVITVGKYSASILMTATSVKESVPITFIHDN